MTIAQRLYLFALGAVLGLVLLGGIGLYQLASFNSNVAEDLAGAEDDLQVVLVLKSADVAFKTQVQEWKNILIRGNRQEDFDKYLKQFGAEEAKVQELLKKTVAGLLHDGQQQQATEADALLKEHQALGVKYREALKSFDVADREAGRKVDQAARGMDRAASKGMEALVEKVEKAATDQIAHAIGEAQQSYEASRNILIVIVLLAVSGGSATVFFVVRRIRNALAGMQQAVEAIPRNWDLRQRVPADGKDEIAQTGRSINLMLENFQEVVGHIIANAQQTAHSCRDMAGSLHEIQQAVAQQNDATSSMAAAVEELTTSFAQIHSNATDSLAATSEAAESAAAGDRVIGEASLAMTGIVGSVQGAAGVIERVGMQSNEISTIVKVIREVADQTNLLALNAAIEAARAGEQGRGFAVVADEVRKLAEKTTSSAEEIRRMIEAVQASASQAVGDIRKVVEEVQTIGAKSRAAQVAMSDIRDQSQKSEGYSRDITDALAEQSSASTLIAQNVENVAHMSEENASHVAQAEQAMRDLEGQSKSLQAAVARFTV